MKVLVTGASGFIGGAVVRRLARDAIQARAAARQGIADLPAGVEQVMVGDLGPGTDWSRALEGIEIVVHAAARVHIMREGAGDPLSEYRRANVEGTVALARQGAAAGVRRFVFLSSIKVNGEHTAPGRPFRPSDRPAPIDPYGLSKLEAEQALAEVSRQTGMEVVIIRPVLVYGPGVKGNFLTLMRFVRRGLPLPLGAVRNRRSLVALDNLVDLIATAIRHPAAAGRVFLAADGDDLSTTDLLRAVARAMGRPARLLPVPAGLLRLAARIAGRPGVAERLLGSLQVDITDARTLLQWSPPVTVDESLRLTTRHFLASAS